MTINYQLLASSEVVAYLQTIRSKFEDTFAAYLADRQSNWLGRNISISLKCISNIPTNIRTIFQIYHSSQEGLCVLQARNNVLIPDSFSAFFKKVEQLRDKAIQIISVETEIALTKNLEFFDENQLMRYAQEDRGFLPLLEGGYEWHLNMALLVDVYQNTHRNEIKRKIGFLILNYLSRNAPIKEKSSTSAFDNMGIFDSNGNFDYHRFSSVANRHLFNFKVAPRLPDLCNSSIEGEDKDICDVFLLERKEITLLLPLFFDVILAPQGIRNTSQDSINQELRNYIFSLTQQNSSLASKQKRFLMDLTPFLKDLIIFDGDNDKYNAFSEKLREIRKNIEFQLETFASQYAKGDFLDKIVEYLKLNICYICQFEMNGTHFLIKVPVYRDTNLKYHPTSVFDDIEITHHEYLKNFIKRSGIGLGAIKCRQYLFDFTDIDTLFRKRFYNERRLLEYTGRGLKYTLYFASLTDLIEKGLFKRLKKILSDYVGEPQFEHFAILGQGIVKLIEGLVKEVSHEKWTRLNSDFEMRQLIQTSLYRLMLHMAKIEPAGDNFEEFVSVIELVHAELSQLLFLLKPFQDHSFPDIFLQNFTLDIEGLYSSAGVTSCAQNFGMTMLSLCHHKDPSSAQVFEEGIYYENASTKIMTSLESALRNKAINKINFYLTEFYHNCQSVSFSTKVDYSKTHVAANIERIFREKPDTDRLTVLVDSTIDYTLSPDNQQLIERFQGEIVQGRIQFMFFKSGIKMEMFGMDNYHGAPFVVINNGEKYWKELNAPLFRKDFQTDELTMQWFCLAYKYAFKELEWYKSKIFKNTQDLISRIPQSRYTSMGIQAATFAKGALTTFIHLKTILGIKLSLNIFKDKFAGRGVKCYINRSSFGFLHPNFIEIGNENIRINPGLDPKDNEIIEEFLKDPLGYGFDLMGMTR
jgi:hypothetical protein